MSGYTLDAGALIAFERNDREVVARLDTAVVDERMIAIPAGVLAQVWRDGRTQVRLGRLLVQPQVFIQALDARLARAAGRLCGARRTTDIVDASVVVCASLYKHAIITSDPDDLARLDPRAQLIVV